MQQKLLSPELVGQTPLDARIHQYQAEIVRNGRRVGINPATILKAVGVIAGLDAVFLGPSVAEAMINHHMDPLSAHIYALASLFTAGNHEHIDIDTAIATGHALEIGATGVLEAWRTELPKLAAEHRLLANELFIIGAVAGAYERYTHNQAVREGTAKIKKGGEQMFVFGGSSSNIADALALDDREHVIPIFDNATGGDFLVSKFAPQRHGLAKIPAAVFAKAVFLNLGLDSKTTSHRDLEAWNRLDLSESNLIVTKNGKRYLLCVGCGETPEEELHHKREVPDITLEETHTYTEMVASRLEKTNLLKRFKPRHGNGIHDFQEVKIYLGSADTPRLNPVTNKMDSTDREVATKGGIDIYIDTWRANLWGLKQEIEKRGKVEDGIILVSSVPEYRELFQNVGKALGIDIITPKDETEIQDKYPNATLCVYEEISDATLNAARRLKNIYTDRNIIALTSNISTAQAAAKENIDTVCSAVVVRNLLKAVKSLLKEGVDPKQIQEYIDKLLITDEDKNESTH